jgi:hypothetical protein
LTDRKPGWTYADCRNLSYPELFTALRGRKTPGNRFGSYEQLMAAWQKRMNQLDGR